MFLIIPLLKVLLYHDSVIDATTTQCQINNKLPRNVFLRLFKRTSKKTSKLRVTGLCKGNFPGEFPAQKTSNAENVSILWRHYGSNSLVWIVKKGVVGNISFMYDDVIKRKHYPRYWSFVRGIHRSPSQRPVTRSFDVFFGLRLNKRLSKQSWGWWFKTLSLPLWHHSNGESLISEHLSVMALNYTRLPLISDG